MINFPKRIQSRLSRKGIAVSTADIKEYIHVSGYPANLTDDDVTTITEYFINRSTALVSIDTSVDSLATDNSNVDGDGDGNVDGDGNGDAIAPLATTNKSELVSRSASELGVVLSDLEISNLASNINLSSDDLDISLEEIKSAIIAFIQYKVSVNRSKINDTLREISQVAEDGFKDNSEQLTNGLRIFNNALTMQSADFKSKIRASLTLFKVPVG